MGENAMKIGIVAPSSPFDRETAAKIEALAGKLYPEGGPELRFHPQCFETHNHFAGTDESRARAFLEVANDPQIDAVWFARGGYGACRIAETAMSGLEKPALEKIYLGYSDAGTLLAPLYKAGCRVAHGPMCQDIVRENGASAVERALRWLVDGDADGLEPTIDEQPAAAFNMTVLSQILGTKLQPDITGHVLMLEEVSEYAYSIDRTLHHITANPEIRKVVGIRLGRCSDIPENNVDFGLTPEEVARHWCDVSGISYLGTADIGHDTDNKIVPFGAH